MSYGPYFAPNGPSLDRTGRPIGVRIAQVFFWTYAAFAALGCCFMGLVIPFAGLGLAAAEGHMSEEDRSGTGLTLVLLPLVYIAVAVLYGMIALHLGRGRRWAQVTVVGIGAMTVLLGFLSVVSLIAGAALGVDHALNSDMTWRNLFRAARIGGAVAVPLAKGFAIAFWVWVVIAFVPTMAVLTPRARAWFR